MPSQPVTSEPVSAPSDMAGSAAFPQAGVPQIGRINRRGLWTLYMKEVRRFFKVQTQTIWAPALSTLLFLVLFDVAFGRAGLVVLGVSFATFIAPGLIAMGMMNNAFANSSFSLLVGKIQGTIVDYLMPPLSEAELMVAMVGAAMTRAVLVGGAVALATAFYPGVELAAPHPWAIVWFGLMGALMLSFIGLLTSLWAEKFDHNAAVTNFIISPLTLLSGTFYTIQNLSEVFQAISRANPFFYVISGFRYGFLGRSDIGDGQAVVWAAIGLFAFNAVLGYVTYRLLRSGWKIRN